MMDPDHYPEGWRIRKFDLYGPKRGVQTTGQEAPVPRLVHRSPPKTVVTEATVEATGEESSTGSNSSEGMETTDEGATSDKSDSWA
jgi:hypothetical protein